FIQSHKYSGVGAGMQWNQGAIDVALGEALKERIDQCVQIGASTAAANMQFADEPSSPGEFPRRVTGLLADNISSEVAGSGLNVAGRFGVLVDDAEGVDLIYALLLQTGWTSTAGNKVLPRPWLTLTLSEIWDQWKAILGQSGTPYVKG
ncbi:MAG: hypothetical protein WC565_09610, partial [Parcubacteria group bacterium]